MSKRKKSRVRGGFLMLPHEVLKHPRYAGLSYAAVKLLVDIGSQYNGKNNGDLAACMSVMRPKGWTSSATLHRAKQELVQAGFIIQSRQGGMNTGPNLYALSWKPVDECLGKGGKPKHDLPVSKAAPKSWRDAA